MSRLFRFRAVHRVGDAPASRRRTSSAAFSLIVTWLGLCRWRVPAGIRYARTGRIDVEIGERASGGYCSLRELVWVEPRLRTAVNVNRTEPMRIESPSTSWTEPSTR